MATIGDLVLRVEEQVYGTGLFERPDEDTLDAAIANGTATSMAISTSGFLQRGDYAEFVPPDGSVDEIVYAHAVSGATITIRRGPRGSTAAAQADESEYRRNPPFTRVAIAQRIQDVIDSPGSLWPHVWSWYQGSLTFATDDHLYDLPQYIEEVVSVYQSNINSDGKFAPIHNGVWEVERQVSSSVSTNKNLLRLGRVWDEGTTVYYTAKRRPFYADLANIDANMEPLIIQATVGKLLMERGPQVDGSQRRTGKAGARDLFAYGQNIYAQFERARNLMRRSLLDEHPPMPKFKQRMRTRW